MKRRSSTVLLVAGLFGIALAVQQPFSRPGERIYSVPELSHLLAQAGARRGGQTLLVRGSVLYCNVGFCWEQPADLPRLAVLTSTAAPDAGAAPGETLWAPIVAPAQDEVLQLLRGIPVLGRHLPSPVPIFPSAPSRANERAGLFRVRLLAHPVCSRWSRTTCYRIELYNAVL